MMSPVMISRFFMDPISSVGFLGTGQDSCHGFAVLGDDNAVGFQVI
jgi:hypothetical protein